MRRRSLVGGGRVAGAAAVEGGRLLGRPTEQADSFRRAPKKHNSLVRTVVVHSCVIVFACCRHDSKEQRKRGTNFERDLGRAGGPFPIRRRRLVRARRQRRQGLHGAVFVRVRLLARSPVGAGRVRPDGLQQTQS